MRRVKMKRKKSIKIFSFNASLNFFSCTPYLFDTFRSFVSKPACRKKSLCALLVLMIKKLVAITVQVEEYNNQLAWRDLLNTCLTTAATAAVYS